MLGDENTEENKSQKSSFWKILLPFLIVAIVLILTLVLTNSTQTTQNGNTKTLASPTNQITEEKIVTPTAKTITYGNLTITILDADSQNPIEGVKVKLNDEEKTTDTQGIVIFTVDNQGKTGTLLFSKEGYEDNSFDAVLNEGSQELKLYKKTDNTTFQSNMDNLNPNSGNLTITVYIDGQPASNGTVELRGEDDSLIDSQTIVDYGSITFQNVPDENVYAVYSNDYFTDQKSDLINAKEGETSIYAYSDQYAQDNGINSTQGIDTLFKLKNNNGNPGELQIFASDNNIVVFKGEITEFKTLKVNLKDGSYTASFLSLGQIIKLDSFQAGDNVTIDVTSDDSTKQKTNSVELLVKTFFNKKPIDDVTIQVMKGEDIIAEETTQNDSLDLNLEKGEYDIKASKDYAKGFTHVSLDSGKVISIELNTGKYLLRTFMQNENNTKVEGFVTLTQDNLTQKCPTVNGVCLIPVQEGEVSITGKAEGYESAQADKTITTDDSVILTLTNNYTELENPIIKYMGIYKNGQIQNHVNYGEEYEIAFNTITKTNSIIYLRVAEDTKDLLGITAQSIANKNVKFKSSTYSNDQDCKESINFNEGKLGFKWIAINLQKGSQNNAFKIKVADNIIGTNTAQIYYKIEASNEFTCHANTQNKGIMIYGLGVQSNGSLADTQKAQLLNILNTPSDPESEALLILSIDKDGVLKANKDSQEFVIDDSFPADSTPFQAPPSVLTSFEGPNQDCFSQVKIGEKTYFLLKTKYVDTKTNCPITQENGKLKVDNTKKTFLKAAYLDAKGSTTILKLPITITVKDTQTIVALPKENNPSSYSRTIFVGSQSIIPTTLNLGVNTESFTSPDLRIKFWNGDGSPLTLANGQEKIQIWTWRQKPADFAVESIAPNSKTTGLNSCTGYFCDTTGLSSATDAFKKQTAEFFSSTYNRRGGGKPYTIIMGNTYTPKYFGGFMTRANAPLSNYNFNVAYTNEPATYKAWGELKTDAKTEIASIDWKAEFYKTDENSYVAGNCDNTSVTLDRFQQTNGCVKVSDTPNLPTTNEIPSEKDNTPTPSTTPSSTPTPSPSSTPPSSCTDPATCKTQAPTTTYKLKTIITDFTPLGGGVSIQTVSAAGKSYALLKGTAAYAYNKASGNTDDLTQEIKQACNEADALTTGLHNGIASIPFIETGFVVNYSDPNFASENVSQNNFVDNLFASSGGSSSIIDYAKDITGFPTLITDIVGKRDTYGTLNGQTSNTPTTWGVGIAQKYVTVPRWTFIRFTPDTTFQKLTGVQLCTAVCREKPGSISLDINTNNDSSGNKIIEYTAVIRKGITSDCRSIMPPDATTILKMSKPQDFESQAGKAVTRKQTLLSTLTGTLCDTGKQIEAGLIGSKYYDEVNVVNSLKALGGMSDTELKCNSKLGIFSGATNILRNTITVDSINALRKEYPNFFQQYYTYLNGAKSIQNLKKTTTKTSTLEKQTTFGCPGSTLDNLDPQNAFKCVWKGLSNTLETYTGITPDCQASIKSNSRLNFIDLTTNTICDSEFLSSTQKCINSVSPDCILNIAPKAFELDQAYDEAFGGITPTPVPTPIPG